LIALIEEAVPYFRVRQIHLDMLEETKNRASKWMTDQFDEATQEEVARLMANDPEELEDAFYRDLNFGTGGLRGVMGVGTNRMNIYTVGYATQGLANYVKKSFPNEAHPAVAIAYDSRNNSALFARRAAEILSANGLTAHLYEALRPTPVLSFAKVYWEDGGQLVPPHDSGVIEEVRQVDSPDKVNADFAEERILGMGVDMDNAYIDAIAGLSELPGDHRVKSEIKVCFTSLHGTGITMVPAALKKLGFTDVHLVAEQSAADGNFPTVDSPNPEEQSAMRLGLLEAERIGADILFGTDPDADRVGMAVRNDDGKLVLLNGNEAAALLIYFLLSAKKEQGDLNQGDYIAKTIVTTELLREIADSFGVKCQETLTGFKYIAERIRLMEGKGRFIGGGEESYGYLVGEVVRDKDAVVSAVMLSEMAAWAKTKGLSPYELLKEIRVANGFYKEDLVSLVKKGKSGAEEIQNIMRRMREEPPAKLAGSVVTTLIDHLAQTSTNLSTGEKTSTGLPTSNVLQFLLADGSKVTARPSGTEPKIKYYISVRSPLGSLASHDEVAEEVSSRIVELKEALGV